MVAGTAVSMEHNDRSRPIGRIRLLLVDDNSDNLLSLEATLQGLADELVSAQSGTEVLRHMLENDDFAAILLDVKMPEMDGFEIAELIRTRRNNRHTPILFLTAFPNDDHLFRGYDLGAVDFLFKPITPEILRSKVSVFVELARNTQLLREKTDVLERAERKFRGLLEASPDALFITRGDGDVLLVNSHTREMFHYERRDLLGRNLNMLIPDWRPGSRMSGAAEFMAVRKGGDRFPIELSQSPLETDEGLLITSVVRDITERKQAEESIRQLNAELEQRVVERTAALMRSNEALRQFAWAASHDLQEPLRMVVAYSQLLNKKSGDWLNPAALPVLDEIFRSATRMNELLAGLRDFMQASERGDEILQRVDSDGCLDRALAALNGVAPEQRSGDHARSAAHGGGDRGAAGAGLSEPDRQCSEIPHGRSGEGSRRRGAGRRKLDFFGARQRHRHRSALSRAHFRGVQAAAPR